MEQQTQPPKDMQPPLNISKPELDYSAVEISADIDNKEPEHFHQARSLIESGEAEPPKQGSSLRIGDICLTSSSIEIDMLCSLAEQLLKSKPIQAYLRIKKPDACECSKLPYAG